MQRYWRMFIALWPFYAIALLIGAIVWAIKSPPPMPASTPTQQTVKPNVPAGTPQEILQQCKAAVKSGDLERYNQGIRKLIADSREYKEARQFYADFKIIKAKEEKKAEAARVAALKPKREFQGQEFQGQCIYLRGSSRDRSSRDSVFISVELHKLSPEYPPEYPRLGSCPFTPLLLRRVLYTAVAERPFFSQSIHLLAGRRDLRHSSLSHAA